MNTEFFIGLLLIGHCILQEVQFIQMLSFRVFFWSLDGVIESIEHGEVERDQLVRVTLNWKGRPFGAALHALAPITIVCLADKTCV